MKKHLVIMALLAVLVVVTAAPALEPPTFTSDSRARA